MLKFLFPKAEPHEYVAAWGASLGMALFGTLPLDSASALGGWLGRKLGPRFAVAKHARRNLARAMPELSEAQREKILDGMWDNLGRVLAEYSRLGEIDVSTPEKPGRIEIVNGGIVTRFRDAGQPVIYFSAHYGNWELPSKAPKHFDVPLLHVYRAANNPLTEQMLQKLRKPVGGRHIPKGMQAARELLKAIKNRESIAMLVDQKLNSGIPVPFFGIDAMTAPAIAEFALRTGSPLVPAYCERLGGAHFRLTFEEPMILEDTGDRHRDIYEALVKINKRVEDWIRKRPDHWFWVHKRWPKE